MKHISVKKLLTTLVVTAAVAASATIGASACTTIYVGANRTTEGTPFVARTEDYGSNMNKMWFVSEAGAFKAGDKWIGCPGYGEFEWVWTHDTYRFTYFTNDIFNGECPECGQKNPTHWSYTEFGTNEKGVSVSATETISGNAEVKKIDPNVKVKKDGVVGIEETDIPTIILGEAASAREGIELLCKIYDEYGAFYDSGIFICDKDEVWYIENCSGTQYVAIKLNDDMIFLEPNLAVIGEIDLDDPNVIASEKLIEVAQKAGTFKGNAEENIIDYRASYARLPGVGAPRMVDGLNFLNKNYKYVDADLVADNTKFTISNVKDGKLVPLYTNIEADRKLTTNDVFNYYHLSTIGKPSNQEIEIFQLFKDAKTVEEGTVGWVGVGNMSYNVFVPYYPVAMKAATGTSTSPIYQGYENRANDDIYDGYQVSLPVVTTASEKQDSGFYALGRNGSYTVYPEGWEKSYYFSFEGLGDYMANAEQLDGVPVSEAYKANAKAELQTLQNEFITAVKDGTLKPSNTVAQGREMAKKAHELALKLIPVATVNGEQYTSVSDAISAVTKVSGTVKLLRDTTEAVTIPAGKAITLDLNGHKLSAPDSKNAITVAATAELTVTGKGTVESTDAALKNGGDTTVKGGIFVQNVTAPASNAYYAFTNSGALTVDAGTFVQTVSGKPASNTYYMFDEIGTVDINGGFFNCKNLTPVGNAKLTIGGGYFSADPSAYLKADQAAVASSKDGYPFTVAAKSVPADTAVAEPEANLSADTAGKTQDVADAMNAAKTALDGFTVDETVKAAAMSAANDPKVITDALIAKAKEECGEDAVITVEPYLDVKVTNATVAGSKTATITVEIEAKYNLVAASSDGDTEATLVTGKTLAINTPMELSIPLPAGFAAPSDNVVFVKHIKADGTVYFYQGTVDGDNNLTFTNPNGFSTFVIGEAPAASVTSSGKTTYYETLQEAVNAVANKGTVKLEKACGETVTVSKALVFTLNTNGKTFSGEILAGSGFDIAVKDSTYTITARSSDDDDDDDSSGGSSSSSAYTVTVSSASNGSVTASPKRAEKGDSVTLTVKPNSGYVLDALTVTDKNGDTVKTTEKSNGTYTFQMPASAVTVKATFTKVDQGSGRFVDVSSDSWYYNAVEYAVEHNLLSGTSANTFSPSSSLTRGMLVQILWSMEGKPAVSAELPFSDVAGNAWYTEAVRWATAKNIVSGIGDGKFAPEANVTREQLALILYNYAGKPASSQQLSFTDAGQISPWAADALRWAVGSGIISGKGGNTLDPQGTATRAEVAQIMMKFDQL